MCTQCGEFEGMPLIPKPDGTCFVNAVPNCLAYDDSFMCELCDVGYTLNSNTKACEPCGIVGCV